MGAEEPNQVLLSYRRDHAAFADALCQRLKGFGIAVFRDEEGHKYGEEWRPVWRQQLDLPGDRLAPELGPAVVIIAADSEIERAQRPIANDIVVREIWEALTPTDPRRQNPLIVLRFGTDGWDALLRRLSEKAEHEGRPELLAQLKSGALHQPQPFDGALLHSPPDATQWNEICRPIVSRTRTYFLRGLREEQSNAKLWAKRILARRLSTLDDEDSFSHQSSRLQLDKAIRAMAFSPTRKTVVAVGAGGLGKTTQVAQTILSLLDERPDLPFFPIVLSVDELSDIDRTLRARLGLTWLTEGHTVSLSDEGLKWFENKICFVSDSLERSDDVQKTAVQLDRLRAIAKLLITSRPEAWSQANDKLLTHADDVTHLDLIGDLDVQKALRVDHPGFVSQRAYLRNPVFLDIAVHLRRAGRIRLEGDFLAKETQLLDEFRNFCITPDPGKPATTREYELHSNTRFLETLALQQIDDNRFDVLWKPLNDDGHDAALQRLVHERPYAVIEGPPDGTKRVRLRHDLIDAYNIANVAGSDPDIFQMLIGAPGPVSTGKLHLGFGQLIFEGIVQAAHDRNRFDVISTFFLEFLRLVDNKKHRELQAAAWISGYVITARFRIFADLIKRALTGTFLKDEPTHPGAAASTLDGLTQNAMSSVAALLCGQAALSIDDEDGSLLSALFRNIYIITLRARLIESLAKINRPDEIVSHLLKLAVDTTLIQKDPGLVRYIARALVDVVSANQSQTEAILQGLERLRETFLGEMKGQLPSIMREIERAQREVSKADGRLSPRVAPLTSDEVAEGLRNIDPAIALASGGRVRQFSDWVVVENYLSELRRSGGRVEGRVSDEVVLSVGRSLWHFHQRVREQAIATLGHIDHPLARGMLLHILTLEVADGLERAIVEALKWHTERLRDGNPLTMRRFFLALVRATASRSRLAGDPKATELLDLIASHDRERPIFVTEYFIELERFSGTGTAIEYDPQSEPARLPNWLTTEEVNREVGPELEAKLAFRYPSGIPSDLLRISRSSWQAPRRFHVALQERDKYFCQVRSKGGNIDGLQEIRHACSTAVVGAVDQRNGSPSNQDILTNSHFFSPPWEDWKDRDEPAFARHVEGIAFRYSIFENCEEVPAIAAIHAILLFSDGFILEGKRSLSSAYAPGAWAASFEEQMRLEDLLGDDAFGDCLIRGINEEFGAAVLRHELTIHCISLGVEWELQNTAAVVVVTLSLSHLEFLKRRASGTPDNELTDLRLLPFHSRVATVSRSPLGFWFHSSDQGQHPTNCARLALAIEAIPAAAKTD